MAAYMGAGPGFDMTAGQQQTPTPFGQQMMARGRGLGPSFNFDNWSTQGMQRGMFGGMQRSGQAMRGMQRQKQGVRQGDQSRHSQSGMEIYNQNNPQPPPEEQVMKRGMGRGNLRDTMRTMGGGLGPRMSFMQQLMQRERPPEGWEPPPFDPYRAVS